MFLTKIRERQFAKKWGGAYNLSRAVLAGVLAAGCLMPGFAEAAILFKTPDVNCIPDGNTATIIEVTSGGSPMIYWRHDSTETEETGVDGCIINVNYVNSTQNITITPEITIRGGYVYYANDNAISNTVKISNVKFENLAHICGGYSFAGTAKGNSVIISGGTVSGGEIYGGYSLAGTNSTANNNIVSISGGTVTGSVFGGSANVEANENRVIISGSNITGDVYGGRSSNVTANDNRVIISGSTITGDVYGGSSYGTANDNKVILVGETFTGSGNIVITGTVYGGVGGAPTDRNELHVYGSNINVGKIMNFQKLHFFIDDKMTFGDVMLTITGDSDTYISASNVSVNVDGAPKAKGDLNTITLIQKTGNGAILKPEDEKIKVNFGSTLTGTGTVALTEDQKDLVLTLKNIRVNENGKSLVETRAAAAFVVNNMSDFMLGTGMEQAKAAAGGVTPIDEGKLTPFDAVGGSNMRYTTGSYVDVNGWNGAVGFAKQADKLLFGVAVEHGRGNYDSYLDNGVHASGDIKSTGGVIFGEYKLDNGVHYDAALRAGRVKSDYNSTATSYDESSAYYGFSLGGGKELTVSNKATLDVYGRYYFSHTNGSDVSIATGEEINFDAVNSHRLRIGGRYTTTLTEKSKAYAGLAWQYEFCGDAKAAINGYSAPTPSLQGHSAIVEAGYKLNAGKNLTLDFNLNGAMGKQRGIGGGIGAQWLF